MVPYPVRVPRSEYRGRDPAKLRRAQAFDRAAAILEAHLNAELEKRPAGTHVFTYGGIAIDTKLDRATVEDVLYGVDAGGNGLTVFKE